MSTANPLFNRSFLLQKLAGEERWDVLIIGGGATGLGIAVDAARRGYSTLLLESADFAKGTSSRSTKLVHGGVRYLAQGNIPLVYSALQERGLLLQNAPHVVRKRAFIIPCFSWAEGLKYLVGLKLYDTLSGKWTFGKSRWLSKAAVMKELPGIEATGLKGGVMYFDGQFDDARLAVNLAQTAIEQGAVVLNYIEVTGLLKNGKQIVGVTACEKESGTESRLYAKTVINATGVFADTILQMDRPKNKPLLKQSQGVHLVFDASCFPATSALMIPKTRDGRVLFAIPWHHRIVVGTTDTPVNNTSPEPVALEDEIDFILETLNAFLKNPVTKKNIQAIYAGLRPLVLSQKEMVSTKELSRDHKIVVSESSIITIIGGKWTTYRKMAEDALNTAIKNGLLPPQSCRTKDLPIHGAATNDPENALAIYGSDAMDILRLRDAAPHLAKRLHPKFPFTEAEVIWAVRNEMATGIEDVLARRLRLLFLDAAAAIETAPRVAQLLRDELGKDTSWEEAQVHAFRQLALSYKIATHSPQPQKQF